MSEPLGDPDVKALQKAQEHRKEADAKFDQILAERGQARNELGWPPIIVGSDTELRDAYIEIQNAENEWRAAYNQAPLPIDDTFAPDEKAE